jgi:hypothetical protein
MKARGIVRESEKKVEMRNATGLKLYYPEVMTSAVFSPKPVQK